MNEEIKFYKELAEEIRKDGYRSFLHDENGSAWLYVITPGNSWLYIDKAEYGGFNVSFEYAPSRDCGSGCCFTERPIFEITSETLADAERYGRCFSFRGHKPTPYADAMNAMNQSYFGKTLIEL